MFGFLTCVLAFSQFIIIFAVKYERVMKTIAYNDRLYTCPSLKQARECKSLFTFAYLYPAVFRGLMRLVLGVPEVSFYLVADISDGHAWLDEETSRLRTDIAYVLVYGLVADCTVVDKYGDFSFCSFTYNDVLDVLKSYLNS